MCALEKNSLAKNTAYLAVRSLISMFIALYSSRIILQGLGVEDFGVYNVIGSTIAFWGSLRGLLSSSTQRFLNVANALGASEDSKSIFSSSLFLHMLIAGLFLCVVGFLGHYLIEKKLNIPFERLSDAYIVFWASLISVAWGIMTIPFDSAIIAHEEMGVFAVISILDSLGKLLIAFLIPYFESRLIFFGVAYALFSILLRAFVLFYSHRSFPEAQFKLSRNSFFIKEMLSFSFWNFLGNSVYYIVNEGVNFILNIFWGPVFNAARGISYQVYSALNSFSGNMLTAANPRICHLMANGDTGDVNRVFSLTSKTFYFVMLILVLGFTSSIDTFLELWLDNLIPAYTHVFLTIILLYGLVRTLHGPVDSLFLASGNLKVYQMAELSIRLTALLVIYILSYLDVLEPEWVFGILVIMEIVNQCLIVFIAHKKHLLNFRNYVRDIIAPISCSSIVALIVYFIVLLLIDKETMGAAFLRAFFVVLFSCVIVLFLGYTKPERTVFLRMLLSFKKN